VGVRVHVLRHPHQALGQPRLPVWAGVPHLRLWSFGACSSWHRRSPRLGRYVRKRGVVAGVPVRQRRQRRAGIHHVLRTGEVLPRALVGLLQRPAQPQRPHLPAVCALLWRGGHVAVLLRVSASWEVPRSRCRLRPGRSSPSLPWAL
jgi:hypothetical protein